MEIISSKSEEEYKETTFIVTILKHRIYGILKF